MTFPALQGLVTEGETLEEARAMAEDALRCYLQGHLEDGLPIPVEEEASRKAIREAIGVKIRSESNSAAVGQATPSDRGLAASGLRHSTRDGKSLSAGMPGDPGRWVIVAYHNRDINPKTLRSIIRQAGLTIDEFIDLL